MDGKMYQWISALVRDKPDQQTTRPFSPLGRQAQAHYGCGHINKNRLLFSTEDKRRLRQLVLDEVGLDPFLVERLPESRLQMAHYHGNEKLASKPASADHLLLNSADGMLRINGVQIPLHPKSILSAGLLCLNSSIETVEHKTLVVIENLAIMPLCHTWPLPLMDPQALWIYRGDYKSGARANACHDFVARFGADKTVIVFSDMDPMGLVIALTMPHADYWLGPEQKAWRSCLQSKLANREGFDLQANALAYLQGVSDSGRLSDALDQLLECLKQERSSFRQEQMFSRQVGLELFPMAFAEER